MANVRTLKKELSLVLEIIVEECFIVRDLYPHKAKETEDVIAEAVSLFQTTRSQRNTDKTISQKKFYTDLRNSYVEGMFAILRKVEALHEK